MRSFFLTKCHIFKVYLKSHLHHNYLYTYLQPVSTAELEYKTQNNGRFKDGNKF